MDKQTIIYTNKPKALLDVKREIIQLFVDSIYNCINPEST